MPVDKSIKKVLIIGAGPIVIGQACEFDYSGVQAIKALGSLGIETVLVNSNPATIMTDPGLADRTYVEPLTPEFITRVIERERPDSLLPTLGGQTALNLGMQLDADGTLARNGVRMIGATPAVIERAEDRSVFKETMESIGLDIPISRCVSSLNDAVDAIPLLGGFPLILRPSFTLGGAGGSIVYNKEDFERFVLWALSRSPINQVLIEESVLGWKEFELEVMRDSADNVVIVCSVENLDPMGVHTGDSITVAPQQTLTDREYQWMRNQAIRIIRAIGVNTGGANIQFAVDPETGRQVVVEMNPRVSRSSALASKATGYPIAKIAALVAVGLTLDEIPNDITGKTSASFEPAIDYVVTKIPRFTFEKFPDADNTLGTQMKSVGEAMAIGRSFPESFQKALRSMETGQSGLTSHYLTIEPGTVGFQVSTGLLHRIEDALSTPTPNRIWAVGDAFRVGITLEEIHERTRIDPWFLGHIQNIVEQEKTLRFALTRHGNSPSPGQRVLAELGAEGVFQIKRLGFSDIRLGQILELDEATISKTRKEMGVAPVFKLIDTCAAEFEAYTPYHYSTFDEEDERLPSEKPRVVILGGGPNRIGQGIEFDCCCVQACFGLREAGYEAVMVNCNPETVSTDWDTSDRLYFEPITLEDVLAIIEREQPIGVLLQFGGQTPLKLAKSLVQAGVTVLGTDAKQIQRAEDREEFNALLEKLNMPRTVGRTVRNKEAALEAAREIGFPVIVRPSYVLGGRAMVIVHDLQELEQHLESALLATENNSLLVEEFLDDAIEVDVDVIGDGERFIVAGIMEHVEQAGVHSGDSACALPPFSLDRAVQARIADLCRSIARELCVIGLMNVQLAIRGDDIFVLEVNPRASRTVPFVSKVIGKPLARIAAQLMVGKTLEELGIDHDPEPLIHAVKEVVFPFDRFEGSDVVLGPEMKSTGEAMAVDSSFALAFAKAQIAVGMHPPTSGTVFVSVRDKDKEQAIALGARFVEMGFSLLATRGTAKALDAAGVPNESIKKVTEGRPNIVDLILSGGVDLLFNTTSGARSLRDSKSLREAALRTQVPYVTTIAAAHAMTEAISAMREHDFSLPPAIQDFPKLKGVLGSSVGAQTPEQGI